MIRGLFLSCYRHSGEGRNPSSSSGAQSATRGGAEGDLFRQCVRDSFALARASPGPSFARPKDDEGFRVSEPLRVSPPGMTIA